MRCTKKFKDSPRTFREDILKTSSDLYEEIRPELLCPKDETYFVGIIGNRNSSDLKLNLLTQHPEYGFEESRINLIRVNGLFFRDDMSYRAYAQMRTELDKNPERLENYLIPGSITLLGKKTNLSRKDNTTESLLTPLHESRIIPCSYFLSTENGKIVLPKFRESESLEAGYSSALNNPHLFGLKLDRNNSRKLKIEKVLAEMWDSTKKDKTEMPK